MELDAEPNNVPVQVERNFNNPTVATKKYYYREHAATTLRTRTKPLQPRQDTEYADTTTTSPTPTTSSNTDATPSTTDTAVSGPVTASATTRPIVVFPDCLTCAADASDIPAAITGPCATARWTLIRLSTAYIWAPVVGCSGERPECCVYGADAVSTVAETTTNTVGQLATLTHTQHEQEEDYPFPTASSAGGGGRARETLSACPSDHATFRGEGWKGCCPFGFTPAETALGAQTPCVTAYPYSMDVPEVPATSLPTRGHMPVVQTISDSILAIEYELPPPPPPPKRADESMPAGKKAGIAIGSGIAGILCGILLGWAIVRNRRRDREIEARQQRKKKKEEEEEEAERDKEENNNHGRRKKDKGKEVDYSEVVGQAGQYDWLAQGQAQGGSWSHPDEPQLDGRQDLQIYPIYPPGRESYGQEQQRRQEQGQEHRQEEHGNADASPVTSVSSTSPTGSMSWGTASQLLWGAYSSYGQSSSSQEGQPPDGSFGAGGVGQVAEYYGGSWGRQ